MFQESRKGYVIIVKFESPYCYFQKCVEHKYYRILILPFISSKSNMCSKKKPTKNELLQILDRKSFDAITNKQLRYWLESDDRVSNENVQIVQKLEIDSHIF